MSPVTYALDVLNSMNPEEIRAYQEQLLPAQLEYCYQQSPYYRAKFIEFGIDPRDIRTLDDLRRMPIFMVKDDERLSAAESRRTLGHPFGMHLCAPTEDVFLTATTSGTTGTPTFTYTFTEADLQTLSVAVSHRFRQHGVRPGDRFVFIFALGIYATSMSLPGIRRAGAIPIDIDARAGVQMMLQTIDLTNASWLACTPSLAEYLAAKAPEILGKTVRELKLKGLFLTGESWAGIPEVKRRIEETYGCRAYDYWTPAGQACAISCDCDGYHGLHSVAPHLCTSFQDLVDPVTKAPVEYRHGAVGEMVHTSLQRKAVPALKYAYGDVVELLLDECPGCGFKGPRAKVIGRADDMLIVKGVNVYPAAIKEIVNEFAPAVSGEMRVVLTERPPRVVPPLRLKIEHTDRVAAEQLPQLAQQIKDRLHQRLKITPDIQFVPPGTWEKSTRKTAVFERAYEGA